MLREGHVFIPGHEMCLISFWRILQEEVKVLGQLLQASSHRKKTEKYPQKWACLEKICWEKYKQESLCSTMSEKYITYL